MDDEKMVRARCRICGMEWKLPNYIANQYNTDRPYECIYCRKILDSLTRRVL